jgi:hypothetical protein
MLDSLDTLIGFTLIFTVVSLLVTLAVQVVTSLLNLRGLNLAWAVTETVEAILPELAGTVTDSASGKSLSRGFRLADRLLRDPLVSDNQIFNFVGRSTAARPHELFDALRRIAGGDPAKDPVAADAGLLLGKLAALAEPAAGATGVVRGASELAELLARNTLGDPERAKLEAALAALRDSAARSASEARHAVREFERHLAVGLERSQEWFAMHARIVTAGIGLVVAFTFQLDAIEIFRRVSSDRVLREQLVARSATVLGQATPILARSPDVLGHAVAAWKAAQTDADIRKQLDAASLVVAPDETRESVERRLREALQALPADKAEAAFASFAPQVDAAVKQAVEAAAPTAQALYEGMSAAGFELMPAKFGQRWRPGYFASLPSHFFGMLCSALLLSLGAPFWFNLLKNLAGLRSAVASNIGRAGNATDGAAKPEGTSAAV